MTEPATGRTWLAARIIFPESQLQTQCMHCVKHLNQGDNRAGSS